ncbi:hypothetical protein O0I10_011254 [Lichtheimia ornata]|uniref:Response regulatory domain-containing protein n=1 Tax=Lichtheimia ornata TaxID=688661 RepID=A0AAD7UU01_9FUNG|nr:uncharacterized protein O0I10_011254 [Lichtheimia ornata]KAJ8653113.1 hypothetical protein O0I10_011254 [Lichtheimia ornata]
MTATSIEQQEHINDNDNQQQQRGIRILLVDDNFVNLQVLSRVLRMHMASIIQHIELAKSGIQALELLCHHAYDLVLLDIDMPVLSGLDTARQIRTSSDILAENRVIPIVAVTTNDTADWKRLFVQCGMNGFISKPVVPTSLKKTLIQVLNTGHSPESLAPFVPLPPSPPLPPTSAAAQATPSVL